MCYKLSAELILLNYFAKNTTVNNLPLSKLGDLASKIAKACNYSIIVDTTRDEVDKALQHPHGLLSLEEYTIRKNKVDSPIWNHIYILNMGMPASIKDRIISVL